MYQINIFRHRETGESVDINAVYAALEAAGVEIDKDERPTGSENAPDYVYTSNVSAAVAVINSLGYPTDEDAELGED